MNSGIRSRAGPFPASKVRRRAILPCGRRQARYRKRDLADFAVLPDSVNQRLPSGPAVIPHGPDNEPPYSVMLPLVVIFPILPFPFSVNHRLPSGPAVMRWFGQRSAESVRRDAAVFGKRATESWSCRFYRSSDR